MARRTIDDFMEQLHARLAYRTDITSAERVQYLNDALRHVINEFPIKEYEGLTVETVLAGASTWQPAVTNVMWPKFLKDMTNERPIDYTSLEDIERTVLVVGDPEKYYWYNGTFHFNRTLSQNISMKLWYKRSPDEWTIGSPEFDQMYDPLIPMKAAAFALDTYGDQQNAHIQETAYNNAAARLRFPTQEHEKNDSRLGLKVRMR